MSIRRSNRWPLYILVFLLAPALILPGCNITKKVLTGDQVILDKNKVKGVKEKELKDMDDYIRYKPNRKILGVFKFHLWMWRLANIQKKKDGKVKKFVQDRAEAPVLLDSSLIELTVKNMEQYAFNKGYFHAKVTHQTKISLNRATVTYTVNAGEPYKVDQIRYFAYDRNMNYFVKAEREKTLIQSGKNVDFDVIAAERERITTNLRNQGYYYFNRQYIDVKLDSSIGEHKVNVSVFIRNYSDVERHEQQCISKITVRVNYDVDTLNLPDTIVYGGITYLLNGFPVLPSTLAHAVLFVPGDFFSQRRLENTYSRLLDLDLFKFVNVDIEDDPTEPNALKMTIYLIPSKKREYGIELQAITSDQNRQLVLANNNQQVYGIVASLSYKNKNLFRDASVLELRTRTSIEAQFLGGQGGFIENFQRSGFEQSVTANLSFPKLLGLSRIDRKPWVRSSRTTFSVSYVYESTRDYTRKMLPASFTWQQNLRRLSVAFTPVEISFNRPDIRQSLLDSLSSSTTPAGKQYLENIFTRNIITDSRVTLIYTGRRTEQKKGYFYLKTNVLEWAGNLLWLFRNFEVYSQDQEAYTILGVKYFQYVKSDFDLRYNYIFNQTHAMVVRLNCGTGYAYGNSRQLPFERRFFVGGTNSLRAWKPRVLGPGSYTSSADVQIDKTGELLLLSNIEYRFDVIEDFLEGALFMDAGNIWNIRADTGLVGAEFRFNRFAKEIAMNTGIGARFDFSFFLIRLDWGIPVFDPSFPEGQRNVIRNFGQPGWIRNRTSLNLGIGYPF